MIEVKKLKSSEIEIFLSMCRERALWLESIGKPMWSLDGLERHKFIKNYHNPDCFIAYVDNNPVGGLILTDKDDFLWGKNSHKEGALYLHKLFVNEGYTGRGYAQMMVKWALAHTKNNDFKKLRLDCFYDRIYLVKLYSGCDFHMLNIAVMPDGTKIAQFEKEL